MSIRQRRQMKAGLSATVDLEVLRQVEDITITRRAKLSPIVNEILILGIQKYEEKSEAERFKKDLEDAKEIARLKAARAVE